MKVYRFGELLAAVANLLCIAKASSSNKDERSRTDPNAQEAQSLLLLSTIFGGECSRHKNIGSTHPSEPIPEEPTIILTTLDEKMLECIGNIHMYFDKYLVWVALAVGIRTDPYHNLNGINEETVRDMVKLLVKLKTTIEKINMRGNGQTVNEDPNIFYVIFQNIDKELAKKDYEEVCNRISSRIIDNANIIKILSCFNSVIAYLSAMSGLCREMHEKCNGKLTDHKCEKPSISVKLLELIEKYRNDELCKEICKTDNLENVCCQKSCGDEEQRKHKDSSVNLGLDINMDIRDLMNRLLVSLTDGLSPTNFGTWVNKDIKQQTKCGDCNSNTTKTEEKTLKEPSSSQSKAIPEIMLELLARVVVEKLTEDSEVKTHEVASKCHDVKDQDDAMLQHISNMFNEHLQSIHNLMEVYKMVKAGENSKVNSFDNLLLNNSEETSTRTQSDLSDKIIELLKTYFDTNVAGKNGSNAEDGKKVK